MNRYVTRLARPAAWLITLLFLPWVGPWAHSVPAQQLRSRSDVFETIEVKPSFFVILGAGGNIAVQIGPQGVILVDTGSASMADKVLAAIKAITDQPIRYIINTSADADHVGGNEKLSSAGVSLYPINPAVPGQFGSPAFFGAGAAIFAREEVLLRMSAPTGQQSPYPLGMQPTETYTAPQRSIYLNGDGIQTIHPPAAHSDADSIVFFRRADVIVTGDIMDLRYFPVIDVANGGSIQGVIDALNRLVDLAIPAMPLVWQEPRTYLIPGHGRIADHADLVEYRDVVTIIRDRIQTSIGKGMTLEQVKAANPTAGHRTRYGTDSGPWTTDMFVEAVYKSLTGKK